MDHQGPGISHLNPERAKEMSKKAGHVKFDSVDFLNDAVIDTIVTESRDLDVNDFLGSTPVLDSDNDNAQLRINVRRRNSIFLDETLDVYIVLRTGFVDEDVLQSYLSRLSLSLEVRVIGKNVKTSGDTAEETETVKDVISTHRVKERDDPLVLVSGSSTDPDSASDRFIYVLWKVETHIARPKVRCSNPVVQFVPSAVLKPLETAHSSVEDEFMESGVPTSMNILQSLGGDPEFRGHPPLLLASRLSKIVPTGTFIVEPAKEVQTARHRSLRIIPAINSRLRFSRLGMFSNQAKALASLDFEISPFVREEITLDTVGLTLSDGHAHSIMPSSVLALPLKCRQRDEITFIYNLIPKLMPNYFNGKRTSPHILSLSANARIPLPYNNQANIKINWRTSVDLTHLIKSHLRVPSSMNSNPAHDITMTISGPKTVLVHNSFNWSILITNRSKSRSLRLALIPMPKIPASAPNTGRPSTLTHLHQHKSILSSSSTTLTNGGAKAAPLPSTNASQGTEAVMDPHSLFTLTHPSSGAASSSSDIDPAAIVVLSADVMLGPIPPGACQTADIKILALRTGIITFDAVRVVDLDSREGLDVVWLPDIVAVTKENSEEELRASQNNEIISEN